MRILVVGAGSVGSFLGGTLAAAGHEIAILRRGQEPTESRGALELVGPGPERRRVEIVWVGSPGGITRPPDLILLAVKLYDLPAAVEAVAGWPSAPTLTVQNGIGAEEEVAAQRPAAGLLAGSLTTAVELGPGDRVLRHRRGGIGLAPVRGDVAPLLAEVVRSFASGGLPAREYRDAAAMKWSKLLGNLVGNAAAAILDLEPAVVYADARLFAIERRQLLEALAVMDALGLRPLALPGLDARLLALGMRLPEPLGRLVFGPIVRAGRGGKRPSLLLQLRTRPGERRTEVAWLNGAVARVGQRMGISTPVNQTLAALVDEVAGDPERRAWFRGRPDRLLAAISAAGNARPS